MALEKEKQRAQDALITAEEQAEGPKTVRKRSRQPVKRVIVEEEEKEEGDEGGERADKENSNGAVNHPPVVSSLSTLPIAVKRV